MTPAPHTDPSDAPQQILDAQGNPIESASEPGHSALDLLALGAGALLLLSAGKSRSLIGSLLKGSAAAALLGRAARGGGTLGKIAGALHGATPRGRGR